MHLSKYWESNLALGCDGTIVIVTDKPKKEVDNLFKNLWLEIFNFEKQFSRFLPDSELTKFNIRAGLETKISDEFKELLLSSYKLSDLTNGLYNPFILPALYRYGYNKSFISSHINDLTPNYSASEVTDWKNLKIGTNGAKIPMNTAIDLGGCGKGYLADKLAEIIKSYEVNDFWVSLGGDIVASGNDVDYEPWNVYIQNAYDPSYSLEDAISYSDKTLHIASSGTIVRRSKINEKTYHHIIDPKTYKPADTDVLLATVNAKSTLLADVLASCAVILGSAKAIKKLRSMGADGLIMQLDDGNAVGFGKIFNTFKAREVVK